MASGDFNPRGGLENLGSNCYLNTIVQCLRYCPSIKDKLFSDNEMDTLLLKKIKELQNGDGNELKNSEELQERVDKLFVYFNLRKLIHDLYQTNSSISPNNFIRACLKLSARTNEEHLFTEQSDIGECLAFVIDTIHEAKANKINMTINCDEGDIKTMEQKLRYDSLSEFKKIYESSYSWVIDKYYFMIMNNINCEKCDYRTYKYESHNMLSLPIPNEDENGNITIYDCLDHYFGKEVFDSDNQWKCDKCDNKQNNYKQYRMMTTPPTLIISIKRYEKLMNGSIKKISKVVDFPMDLDISNYKLGKNKSDCQYKLFGIANHTGNMNFGHCYAFCRNIEESPDDWFCYNDTTVTKIKNIDDLFSSKAYLFMYYRV